MHCKRIYRAKSDESSSVKDLSRNGFVWKFFGRVFSPAKHLILKCFRKECPCHVQKAKRERNDDVLSNGFGLTLFGREFSLANRFINFCLKRFGEEHAQHVEIVKKLKERNDEIYRTVMVSIVQIFRLDESTFTWLNIPHWKPSQFKLCSL